MQCCYSNSRHIKWQLNFRCGQRFLEHCSSGPPLSSFPSHLLFAWLALKCWYHPQLFHLFNLFLSCWFSDPFSSSHLIIQFKPRSPHFSFSFPPLPSSLLRSVDQHSSSLKQCQASVNIQASLGMIDFWPTCVFRNDQLSVVLLPALPCLSIACHWG